MTDNSNTAPAVTADAEPASTSVVALLNLVMFVLLYFSRRLNQIARH